MLIIRRSNCINTASGMVTRYKCPSGSQIKREFSLNLCTGRPLIESDHTRYCTNTILPPDDEHDDALNM